MPFKSEKQRRFFEGIAHGMRPKGGKGPSKAVAQKFIADSGGKVVKSAPKKKKGK